MTDPSVALAMTRREFAGATRSETNELRAHIRVLHEVRQELSVLREICCNLESRNDFLERSLKAENDRLERNERLERQNVALIASNRELNAERDTLRKNYLAAIDAMNMLRENHSALLDHNIELAGELAEQRQRTEHYADAADRARAERHGLQEALDGANERIAFLQHELSHQRSQRSALYRELRATCNAAAEALAPFITHEWLSDVPASAFQRAQTLHDQLAGRFD